MLLMLAAFASEVTAFPEPMGVGLAVTYRGFYELGDLEEGDQMIAKRRLQEHHVDAGVEFSPFTGVALTLGLEASPHWSWTYPEARTMLLEPVEGGGSYLFSNPSDPAAPAYQRKGSGLTGVWVGGAVAPFSEALFANQKVSWRLDFAMRPGSKKSNRWTVNDAGKRGASPGSLGVRVAGAFSRKGGIAEPYVRAIYRHEGKVTLQLADETGTMNDAFTVDPGSSLEVIGGTGVLANEDDSSAFDVHIGAVYKSWEDLPTGMLLPNVIDAAKTVPATHSESFTGIFGIGADLSFGDNASATLGGRFSYTLPHRQEHLFNVRTSADTFGIHWYLTVRARVSKSDFGPKEND